jgi:hypothetical protein
MKAVGVERAGQHRSFYYDLTATTTPGPSTLLGGVAEQKTGDGQACSEAARGDHSIAYRMQGCVAGPNGAAVRMSLRRTFLVSRIKRFGINPANKKTPAEVL